MNVPQKSPDEFETRVSRALRGLPPRRAPRSLENRVIAELERRAGLPWWRRSIAHWPGLAQAGFVVLCAGSVRLAWLAGIWAGAGFETLGRSGSSSIARIYDIATALNAAGEVLRLLAGVIPPIWIVGGIAFASILYAALFGLCAALYRTLYLNA